MSQSVVLFNPLHVVWRMLFSSSGNIQCLVNFVMTISTSVKIIKNEVGCRDDTVPKTVDTRRHCEEE